MKKLSTLISILFIPFFTVSAKCDEIKETIKRRHLEKNTQAVFSGSSGYWLSGFSRQFISKLEKSNKLSVTPDGEPYMRYHDEKIFIDFSDLNDIALYIPLDSELAGWHPINDWGT